MKTSVMRRMLLVITGILLGLLAGLGISAPAGASVEAAQDSAVAVYKDTSYLYLDIKKNGNYRVEGKDYKAKFVYVRVIDISKKKHRVVDDRWVKTNKYNDFKFTGHGLKCGRTYIAASYSKADGWDYSNKDRFDCRKYGK